MGLIWHLPISLWQSVCYWMLLYRRLGRKLHAAQWLAGAGMLFGLLITGTIFAADNPLLFSALTVFACISLPLVVCSDPWPNTVLWGSAGAAMLFTAELLSSSLALCIATAWPPELSGSFPELLVMLVRIGLSAGIFAPACWSQKSSTCLPSVFIEMCAVMASATAFTAGWAARSYMHQTSAQHPEAVGFAACLVLGLAGPAFALFSQQLSSYYQTQQRLQARAQSAKRMYAAEEDKIAHMKRWQHDEKQHLAVLRCLAARGHTAQLLSYLGEYAAAFEADASLPAAGNRSVDALLALKSAECRDKHIDFRCFIETAGPLPLKDTELVSLLGNAIDNAIEACMLVAADPFVELNMGTQGDMWRVSVANSCAGSYSSRNGQLASTKGINRGTGLSQIRRLAEAAGGFVQTKPSKAMFRLTVWLPRRGK